jgi:alcohol dehydrogenase class IV
MTSGTGTDVSPFSVITDREKGVKYPVFGYDITPDIAIVDPELTYSMPAPITAFNSISSGYEPLSQLKRHPRGAF